MYDRYEKQKIVDAFFKTEMGDGIFALFFYRPLAYLIFKKIIRKPVNPNKITIVTLIFYTLAALLLFIYPIEPFSVILQNKVYGIEVWFLLFLIVFNMAPIFDCMDGAIARLFNKTSAKGRLLDSFVDSFGFTMILIALLKRFTSYAFYIAVIFFVYFAYSNIALSYMLEKARKGEESISDRKTRKIFGLELRIVLGSPDYFIITINLLIVSYYLQFYSLLLSQILTISWTTFLVIYFIVKFRHTS